MKPNKLILWYAIIFNIINGFLFVLAIAYPEGAVSRELMFIFPLFWLLGFIGLIVVAIVARKDLGHWLNWVLLFFCTPLPSFIIASLTVGSII